MIFSVEEEIATVAMGRPHVVLLGAGASAAACPNGDKYGRRLPVMNNLIATVGMESTLDELGVDHQERNFEDVYSSLSDSGSLRACQVIESRVRNYFEDLTLPSVPTIYDHLVSSLRPKDIIATFNWDPLLWQAFGRNFRPRAMPIILCLHGNVALGHCPHCHRRGVGNAHCTGCGVLREPSQLLFPTRQKNYSDDPAIKKEWDGLRLVLGEAFMFTIFGYGAPDSDAEAVKLMKEAWGDVGQRNLEEIEIIDIKTEDELRETWSPFIHTHHYRTTDDFYHSWIAEHPRRTTEAMWAELMDARFVSKNTVPKNLDFPGLREWYLPLLEVEQPSEWARS